MSFIAGLLVGILIGGFIGAGMIILAWSLASQDSERGESDSEAAVGFFLLVLLVWLGLWALSGWALPI